MKVKDIMTRSVAYVNPASTVTEAAQLMQKHNVGSIPVCDQNGVIGIVTDRDIVVRNIAHGKNPTQTPVKDVMTSSVTTVTPDMDISEVTRMMASSQVRRVPVVENNRLVGIVSLGDVATDAKFQTEVSGTLSEISTPSKPEKM
ncbi:MAG: CBS domain-containing protein [Clostridiales bacterium]|nr:CBS domain-containing protein [Eubacteriales bacterium]MDH7567772.1 CBS domain-containing protein [Clostridiales bacterium]